MAPTQITASRLAQLLGMPASGTPSYAWLSDAIRLLVSDGRLLHGTRLPSERDLVTVLGLSRTTVSRAYAELAGKGYAVARRGSGTLVQVPGGPVIGGSEPMPWAVDADPGAGVIDLTCAAPSATPGLAAAVESAAARLGAYTSGMGYFPLGIPELREVIAQRFTDRGVPTSADQIIITTGALAGTAAVARALLRHGARVVLESPTYPNSLATLRHGGARVIPVSTSSGSSDIDALTSTVSRAGAAAMLLLPDFHNPTGTYLEDSARARIAHSWKQHDVVGIVDETAVEMWLDSPPTARPMAAHAPGAVTVGTASKSHWGGLRVGWVRAPRSLVGAISAARLTLDLGAPVLDQLVLVDLLAAEPSLLPEVRSSLRARRDLLVNGLRAHLPQWDVVVPGGALSLWWRLPQARSSAVAQQARRAGVWLVPGSTFAVEGHGLERWLRTPYALDAQSLERAVPLIARAWERAV